MSAAAGWRLLVTAVMLCVSGCSSPQERVQRSNEKVRSWAATILLAGQELERGAIPGLYARQILRAAIQAQNEESKRLEWQQVDAAARRALAERIAQLAAALDQPIHTRAPS